MPVPSTITDLSTSAGSNSPSGSDSPNTVDDNIRALSAIVRKLYDDLVAGAFNPSTMATKAGIETLTNKTLTNPVINGFSGDTSAFNLGSGQLYKDASGNICIGTTTPIAKLTVNGSTALGASAGANALYLYYASATNYAAIQAAASGDIQLVNGTTSPSEKFRIGTSGQWGIGGANYGTAGQVMVSGGPSAAPSWATYASVGVGQTWQDVTASRAAATPYTNSTGKPIQIVVTATLSGTSAQLDIVVDGVTAVSDVGNSLYVSRLMATAIIPPGSTYTIGVASAAVSKWTELR